MGWADHYHKQRQAQQLREIERHTAAAAGVEPRKLNAMERMNGIRDPRQPPPPSAPIGADPRVHELESRVAYLEARMEWAIDVIQRMAQDLQQGQQQP